MTASLFDKTITPRHQNAFADSALFEALPIASYACDIDGRIIRQNHRANQLAIQPAGGSSHLFDSVEMFDSAGEPIPNLRTLVSHVATGGVPLRDAEARLAGGDGRTYRAAISADPIREVGDAVVGAIVCVTDFAPAGGSEDPSDHSADFLRAVIETTPEGVTVVLHDGSVAKINSAGRRMIEGRDLRGRELFFIDLVAPEDRRAWQKNHLRVCAGESRSWSFDIIGLRGTRRHVETHSVPLRMPDGETAQLAITRDVTIRKNQERALLDRERWFRGLLEALPVAVYTTDADGRITFYNGAAAEFWGHRPPLYQSQWCGSWRLYNADGSPLPHDQCPMAVALTQRRPIRNAEAIAERPDGTRVPFTPYPTPLFDADGNMVGAVNMLIDISRHKEAAEHQLGLINELNHRVKNTLATVQSLAQQTFRGHADELAQQLFAERLIALAQAHDVLTSVKWQGANLDRLLQGVLQPICDDAGHRIALRGPTVVLAPKLALSFSLAFHELGRNALRHGALSVPHGSVRVSWQLIQGMEGNSLHLRWSETGGPPVNAARRKGFGSRLIEQGLAHDAGAAIVLDDAVGGLVCDICVPLGNPREHTHDDLSA